MITYTDHDARMKPHGVSTTVTRSANPHPVCRRGHCGLLADPDSEWCTGHGAEVATLRSTADARFVAEAAARKITTRTKNRRA